MVRKFQPFLWLLPVDDRDGVAFAAETTGSISGVVRGADGAGLAGVPVTVKGTFLPAGRTVVTDKDGAFSFQRLLPGTYQVSAERAGHGQRPARGPGGARPATPRWSCRSAPDRRGDHGHRGAAADRRQVHRGAGQLHQRGDRGSARAAHLQGALPARSRRGRERAPGAQRRRLAAWTTSSWSTASTSPTRTTATSSRTSPSSTSRRSASSAAASPPSSAARAAWWSTPSPSRGTNELRGEARVEYQPSSFVAANKNSTVQNTEDQNFGGIALGGPIAARPALVLRLGEPPLDHHHRPAQQPRLGPGSRRLTTKEYFGKLTANPSPEPVPQRRAALARDRDRRERRHRLDLEPERRAATTRRKYLLGTASWTWNADRRQLRRGQVQPRQGGELDRPHHRPRLPAGLQRGAAGPRRPVHHAPPDFLVGGATAARARSWAAPAWRSTTRTSRATRRGRPSRPSRPGANTRHDLRAGVTYEESDRSGWSGAPTAGAPSPGTPPPGSSRRATSPSSRRTPAAAPPTAPSSRTRSRSASG